MNTFGELLATSNPEPVAVTVSPGDAQPFAFTSISSIRKLTGENACVSECAETDSLLAADDAVVSVLPMTGTTLAIAAAPVIAI
jgi:hypothetical protein